MVYQLANNQFVVVGDTIVFQSYSTIVAKIINHEVFLVDGALDFSRTTSKYLCRFLKEYAGLDVNTKTLRKLLASGEIKTLKK